MRRVKYPNIEQVKKMFSQCDFLLLKRIKQEYLEAWRKQVTKDSEDVLQDNR